MTKEDIKTVVELFISWNGENDVVDVANLDLAIDYIAECLSQAPSDVDEAAKLHRKTSSYGGDINLAMQESFKAGAQWQKQQNQETIELAEDHAYFAGKEKLREELLDWTREKFHYYDDLLEEYDDPAHWGQRNAFHQVIDKINSL